MPDSSALGARRAGPARIAGAYLAFSVLWILASDRLLEALAGDAATIGTVQTIKGLVFVAATALLIYVMARREIRELARHNRWLNKVFDDAPALIAYVDPDLRYRFVNEGYARLYGWEAAACADQPLSRVVGDNYARIEPILRRALAGEEIRFDGPIVGADGRTRWLHANYVLDHDRFGEVEGVLIVIVDLTERRAAEAEIAFRANYDALTGLANRNLLLEELATALAARSEDASVALLFVDLDGFKQINDTLGHVIGDRLLKSVGQRLAGCVHEGDTVARLSSDIFIVLLRRVAVAADAGIAAAKAIAAVSEAFYFDDVEVRITASAGIALAPAHGDNAETLFASADLALSAAKAAGRGNHVFFSPEMQAEAQAERELKDEMHRALERNEFRLHFQPVVDLDSGRVYGAEALIRWQHPQRGLVPPGLFIPLAEQSGIIRDIGAWVFEAACRQLAEWRAAGHRWRIAVNVASGQLPQPMTPQWMRSVLQRYGLEADTLTLEITEGTLLDDTEAVLAWIAAVRDMGFHVALDDFGTGYSSLTYLKRFPFHTVKVDQSFVRDIVDDKADRALVDTILAMARSLDLGVVAEGVEHPEQLHLLRTMGCRHAQGYYFARPVPADEFPARAQAIETAHATP